MVGSHFTRPHASGLVIPLSELPDSDLLERFLHGGAIESQDAFHTLVVRHGPLVLGICRQVLDRDHDAEDAFQATFFALARKGGSIHDPRSLANWLREVAYRVALRTRAHAGRRRAVERQALAETPGRNEPSDQHEAAGLGEMRVALRQEVARLPDKYRVPVTLSYLEGRTIHEVAGLLGWPIGTVKVRLMRARHMLRSRLSRQGVFPPEAPYSD